jgi:hypothetical protein
MRRAQLDVQFNWIFVLIAGAVILALFFKVANTQRQLSEDKAAISLQNNFDAEATSALQSKGTIQAISMPTLGLHFDCTDCTCVIKFGRFSVPFDDRSIFTPNMVDGANAQLWTLDWKAPFRVTNTLYITNDLVKYYFVGAGALEDHIQSQLPAQVNAEFIADTSKIIPQNENRVVIVFVDGNPSQIDRSIPSRFGRKTDVHGLSIDSTTNTVTFYKSAKGKFVDDGTQGYFGDPLLFGAIMAQDNEAYTCNVRTSLIRLQGVAMTYMTRANELSNTEGAICGGSDIYTAITKIDPDHPGPLQSIITFAKDAVDSGTTGSYDFKPLQNAGATLESQNEQLLRKSCPTVY